MCLLLGRLKLDPTDDISKQRSKVSLASISFSSGPNLQLPQPAVGCLELDAAAGLRLVLGQCRRKEREKVQQCVNLRAYDLDFLYGHECDSDFAAIGVGSHKVQVVRLDFLEDVTFFVFVYVLSECS